jgi:hypothetical protein
MKPAGSLGPTYCARTAHTAHTAHMPRSYVPHKAREPRTDRACAAGEPRTRRGPGLCLCAVLVRAVRGYFGTSGRIRTFATHPDQRLCRPVRDVRGVRGFPPIPTPRLK